MRIILAGGGTGGHLFPGLALADAIKRRAPDADLVFYGAPGGLEDTLVPEAGWPLERLATGRGGLLSWRRPLNGPRFAYAIGQCLRRFRRDRPDAVVALGGYAAAAPGLAARLLNIPVAVLEQNTVPGRVNRLLARHARQFHSQFAEARGRLAKSPAAFHHTGSPLREVFCGMATEPPVDGDAVLVVGGSQGARRLNEIAVEAAPFWPRHGVKRVVHIAGPAHASNVREGYAAAGWTVVDAEAAPPETAAEDGGACVAEVHGFCRDMAAAYRRARLAVARSGAGSLAEFAAAGLPAALVPLPSAKDDHQRINAVAIARLGAALLLEETALTGEALAAAAGPLFADNARRAAMAAAIRATARPESADVIAGHVIQLAMPAGSGDGVV